MKHLLLDQTLSHADWEHYIHIVCDDHTRIGRAPNNMRLVDRVYVLNGGRESFLLRPAKEGIVDEDQDWELHGECYFEGLELGGEFLSEKNLFEELDLRLI